LKLLKQQIQHNEPTTPGQGRGSGKSPSASSIGKLPTTKESPVKKEEQLETAHSDCKDASVRDELVEYFKNQLESYRKENSSLTMELASFKVKVAEADVKVAQSISDKTRIHLENRRLQLELDGQAKTIEDLSKENSKLASGKI
jgi:predicted RNase H-like nuclease (RuvC/YqgF family)